LITATVWTGKCSNVGQTAMTKRVLMSEPAASPAPEPASDGRLARHAPPPARAAGSHRFPTAVVLPVERTTSLRDEAEGEHPDMDTWLKLPKGVAFGILFAAPCWALLAVWLLW